MPYTLCTFHGQNAKMITADIIEHDHIKRSGGRSLFFKSSHMEALRIWTSMHKLMDSSLVAMESKHDRLISSEVLNKGSLVQAIGMEEGRVQRHEVNDIDHAHLQFREVLAQPPGGGHRLLRHQRTGKYLRID